MGASVESDAVVANPLRASGLVDAAGLERARAMQRERGGLLSDALLELKLVREGDFLRTFAELYSTRYVKSDTLRTLKLDERLLERVGVRMAEKLRMCPIRWDEDQRLLHVVAAIPIPSNLDAELRSLMGAKGVIVYVATSGSVAALVRRWYYRQEDAFELVSDNGAGPELKLSKPGESADEEPPAEKTNVVIDMPELQDTGQEPALADEAGVYKGSDTLSEFPLDPEPVTATTRGVQAPSKDSTTEGKTVLFKLDDELTIATLRKENARFRIAQEFHRRVSLERSLEAMVDRILSVIFELVNADGAAVWLTSGQYAWKSKIEGKKVEVPRAIIDTTLVSPDGVLTHNALVDQRFDRSASVMVRGVQSVMAVPLRTRNGTQGILYVESTSMSAAFSSEDLPMFEAVGSQAAILLDNAALVTRVQKEVENRVSLSRFLSGAAVEEVLSGRMDLHMEGQAAEVTVLFADIRGFTTMSSQLPPQEVVRFLNAFFGEMVDAVERYGGIVDKFIGDCVMALWGAPVARSGDARNALSAALEMVERARKIRVSGERLQVGVGVHTGPAVVGAIGSKQRLDYTAIGATVNLAARLCSIAGAAEVVCTFETLSRAGAGVVSQASQAVLLKGIDQPVIPYAVQSVSQPVQLQTPARKEVDTRPGEDPDETIIPRARPSRPR